MKQTIAVDIDEVLFPFTDEFIIYHDQVYGTKLDKSKFNSLEFSSRLGTEMSETTRRIFEFTRKSSEKNIQPLALARESIAKLAAKYNLVVITARQSEFEEITKNWAAKHFSEQFLELHHIGFA